MSTSSSSPQHQQIENWNSYCAAAGIENPQEALKGFDSVPRYIRLRQDSTKKVISNFMTPNEVHEQKAATSFSLIPVPWLPKKSNFFEVRPKDTNAPAPSMKEIKSALMNTSSNSTNNCDNDNDDDKECETKNPECICSMDASSFVALLALCPKKSDNVLDVCCAPGMKLISICDLLSSSSVAVGIDASLDRALVCRSLLSQYVSQKFVSSSSTVSISSDEFGHCRLYLGDGCTFSCHQRVQRDDQEEIAPNRAEEGLRWEASNPAKLARHQKYQLQKIRKSCLSSSGKQKSLPERRHREDPEEQQQHEKRKQQQRQICFWESEGCPVLWSDSNNNKNENENENEMKSNNNNSNTNISFLGFDRVLVDAECTHDGSVSHIDKFHQANFGDKSPKIIISPDSSAKQSSPSSLEQKLLELYDLQFNLLLNGYRNCKPNGGVIVYSTCSMSPKQNEEIVKRFLDFINKTEEKVRLVDPFEELVKIVVEKSGDDGAECSYSEKLQFDDVKTIDEVLKKEICSVSKILPPCLSLHPSKSRTSVQFIAKFVKIS